MSFSPEFSIKFQNQANAQGEVYVVGVWQDLKLTPAAKQHIPADFLEKNPSFKGKSGQMLSLTGTGSGFDRIVIVGLGDFDKAEALDFELIGAKLQGAFNRIDVKTAVIDFSMIEKEAAYAAHLANGFVLQSYKFDKYKQLKEDQKSGLETFIVVTEHSSEADEIHQNLNAVAQGVFLARDLINEPPNNLHPESYVEIIKEELKPLGIELDILDEKKLEKLGFDSLLNVGKGSVRESQVVVMRWNGDGKIKKGERAPIAFVGKGVTFDTGGISLKPGAEMDLMKMDMGGSAAVVGVMKALAARKASVNAIGIIGLVENMPAGNAYRPGDIIGSLSGKTIEVLNTDAEGRLVLADILTYVQQQYSPKVIIDLATLTGAIMVALGFEYTGVFANDDELWSQIETGGKNSAEKLWRMPLDEAYRKEMESDVADLKNLGSLGRYGGACSAAGFLEHFIEQDTKWAHFDIAGTAWNKSAKPKAPKGGTGVAVRSLNALVAQYYEQSK